MGKLNLEDRQSWQRFQRILTSFIADYIDLLAPEQADIRYDQETLFLGFTLLSAAPDDPQLAYFIAQLEQFLRRLPLAGIRSIELSFISVSTRESLLVHRFPINYLAPDRSIVRSSTSSLRSSTSSPGSATGSRRGGALVRRLQGWLTNSQLTTAITNTTKTLIRQPKQAIVATGEFTRQKLAQTLDWIDTFAWEEWARGKVEWQKRRHRRNLWKALVEDIIFIALIVLLVLLGGRLLSGPTLDLAKLPPQHYDRTFANARYSCGAPGVTRKNYVCLRAGMSYNRVKKILGGEGKVLAIDPRFGKDSSEAKKLLAQQQQAGFFFRLFNRKQSVGEQVATIVSWSDGKGGTINATFLGNRLVARGYRDIQ